MSAIAFTRLEHARDLPLPEYATSGAAGMDLVADRRAAGLDGSRDDSSVVTVRGKLVNALHGHAKRKILRWFLRAKIIEHGKHGPAVKPRHACGFLCDVVAFSPS